MQPTSTVGKSDSLQVLREQISLRCPVTLSRIQQACRSTVCTDHGTAFCYRALGAIKARASEATAFGPAAERGMLPPLPPLPPVPQKQQLSSVKDPVCYICPCCSACFREHQLVVDQSLTLFLADQPAATSVIVRRVPGKASTFTYHKAPRASSHTVGISLDRQPRSSKHLESSASIRDETADVSQDTVPRRTHSNSHSRSHNQGLGNHNQRKRGGEDLAPYDAIDIARSSSHPQAWANSRARSASNSDSEAVSVGRSVSHASCNDCGSSDSSRTGSARAARPVALPTAEKAQARRERRARRQRADELERVKAALVKRALYEDHPESRGECLWL